MPDNLKVTISVFELLGQRAAVSSDDGEKLFHYIKRAFNENLDVEIDFRNIDLTVSTFLNASIGQLYSSYTSEYLRDHLSISNATQDDLRILAKVTTRAKEYFADKKGTDEIIKKNLDDE